MNDPQKYIEENSIQREETKTFLSEYYHFVQWNSVENNFVLDIGCGTGDVTNEILHPLLPLKTKIVGADVSSNMIEYAAKQYPNDTWVIFDIADENLLSNFQIKFDNVFSFYCLHWVKNQRQALKNIYNLLKPGGGMFLVYVLTSVIYDAYSIVGKMNPWKQYIDDPEKFHSPYHNDKNAIEDLQNVLEEIGFNTKICKHVERYVIFPDQRSMLSFLHGINPFCSNIPENMKQSYMNDLLQILLNMEEMKKDITKLKCLILVI